MTIVGVFGIVICLLAYPFAFRTASRTRQIVFFVLFVAHTMTAVFYYYWQQSNTSDSPLYYYDLYGFYGTGFKLNTVFVIYFVQFLKGVIGGTFLDYFLLFQATGFWALVFMMRIFEEVYEDIGAPQPAWTFAILFLPSLHFWTSSIGKDGPLALAAAMAVWSSIHITRRYLVFALAVLMMVFFRPHIALVAIAGLAFALVFDLRIKLHVRLTLGAIVLTALAFVATSVRSTFSVDVGSAGSIADFISTQKEISTQFDTGTAVLNGSFPVKLLSLMFRPFFFDAGGALGIVASFENVLIIGTIGTFAFNFSVFKTAFKQVMFFRYASFYAVSVVLLLAVVYYNVGLGLRQRTMMLPALLSLLVALAALMARQKTLNPRGRT